MIIIKIQGGLGNQMFQYAVGSISAKVNKSELYLDVQAYENPEKNVGVTPRDFELKIFDNQYNIANEIHFTYFRRSNFLNKVKMKLGFDYPKVIIEDLLNLKPEVFNIKAPIYLQGYFQNYRYFIGHDAFIRSLFKFDSSKISNNNLLLLRQLQQENTISVHIRRGDYIMNEATNKFHGCCSTQYYNQAIKLVTSKLKNATLVFFSDDMIWVREQFSSLQLNKIFVESNIGSDSWIDMFLMSQCKHNIIANSSFSWWGAYLNSNFEKIIVAPNNWFAGLSFDSKIIIPTTWIKI